MIDDGAPRFRSTRWRSTGFCHLLRRRTMREQRYSTNCQISSMTWPRPGGWVEVLPVT